MVEWKTSNNIQYSSVFLGNYDGRNATLRGFLINSPKGFFIPGVPEIKFLPGIVLGNGTLNGLRDPELTSSESFHDYINFKSVPDYPLTLVVPWKSRDGRSGSITVWPTFLEISGALNASTMGRRNLVELAGVHITSLKGLNVDFEDAGSQ